MKRILAAMALSAFSAVFAFPAAGVAPDDKTKPDAATKEAAVDVDNPVRKISEMMKKCGELLGKLNTGDPTQDEQKKILKELDRLIEMTQQSSPSKDQQEQQPKDKQDQGQQPQPKNSASSGTSPMPTERNVNRAVKHGSGAQTPDATGKWGELPAATRDEVMQLLNEDLPQQYKQLLKLYFKALSEKK